MTTRSYNVKGMHCASCSAIVTKKLSKVEGVHQVNVNLATEKATLEFDGIALTPEALNEVVNKYGYVLEAEQPPCSSAGRSNRLNQKEGRKRERTARPTPKGAICPCPSHWWFLFS